MSWALIEVLWLGSEIFEYLVEVLSPKVAERVRLLAFGYDTILLHECIINDTLSHWHVSIHHRLHRLFLLQPDELVIIDATCRPAG